MLLLVATVVASLAGHGGALAEPIQPTNLNQPASRADWAAKSVLLSVANAGRRLVAVGERGFVLLSDDDGRTWRQPSTVPTSATLTKVGFANATDGWAVGHMGIVLHTTDGGNNWVKQLDGIKAANLALARAKERLQGTIGGEDAKNLQKQLKKAESLVREGPDKPILSLLAMDANRAFAFGAFGYAFATEDGGRNWLPIFERVEDSRDRHVYGVATLNGALYAAGEQGLFLRSREDGQFEAVPTPYDGTLFGVTAVPGGPLLVYGLRGTLLRSDDAGKHWLDVKSGIELSLTSALVLADGRVVLGSQSGQLIASSDGGQSFAPWLSAPQPVAGLAQAADGSVIVVGPRGISRVELR